MRPPSVRPRAPRDVEIELANYRSEARVGTQRVVGPNVQAVRFQYGQIVRYRCLAGSHRAIEVVDPEVRQG